jgi:nicotinamide-nucleotide adenylyltransferase
MPSIHDEPESMSQLLEQFRLSLASFAASNSTFQLLKTIPASHTPSESPPKTLYVLDSSFNPPTAAHLRIASSALEHDPKGEKPKRLLLLIVTQDSLKPYKPPAFEHRLAMMTLLAYDIQSNLKKAMDASDYPDVAAIDIGVIKKPYFIDKPQAISESGLYPPSTEQVYLTGFDVVLKIFNPEYYPPHHTLAPLEPFLSKHRLRVTYRPDDQWGSKEDQDAYIEALAKGENEDIGGKREWAEKIDIVEGKKPSENSVSSSTARLAARDGSPELDMLVTPAVKAWIISNRLYNE